MPRMLDVVQALRDSGLIGLLVLALVGGWKRWWVFGWHHDRVCARYEKQIADLNHERDDWKQLVIAAHADGQRARELVTT